jgi:hypothetical protein
MPLPSPTQSWLHGVVSKERLHQALADPLITAIEADILLSSDGSAPVMAHPPSRESDLTFSEFVGTCFSLDQPAKHLKLDFKELGVIEPCIKILTTQTQTLSPSRRAQACVYLNADILPGPGCRNKATVEANEFLHLCLPYSSRFDESTCYSLGWSTGVANIYNDEGHYTVDDVEAMTDVITRHDLLSHGGLVFAVSFRILERNPTHIKDLLITFPTTQILVWTGSGEPPIPQTSLDAMKQYSEVHGLTERVGYDCQIAGSVVEGSIAELKIVIVNVYNAVLGWFAW